MRFNILLAVILTSFAISANSSIQKTIPSFSISDGNGKIISDNDIRGKVGVIFYIYHDTPRENEEFGKFLRSQRSIQNSTTLSKIKFFVVVDATSANILTRNLWKKGLLKESRNRDVDFYGDWDGKMKEKFRLPDRKTTFMIISPDSRIVYMQSGKIQKNHFDEIASIIKNLT